MDKPSGIQRALEAFENSPSKLATEMGGGVLRQHVEHWVKAGKVPPRRCLRLEEISGVSRKALRPDDWRDYWPEASETLSAAG